MNGQPETAEVKAFWAKIDARIDERALALVKHELLVGHPRGAANVALSAGGTPGAFIAPSLLIPVVMPRIDFPIEIDLVHVVADTPGSMQFDIWVQRPGQLVSSAVSICGGAYPALVATQESALIPRVAGWLSTHIEAGSVVSLYVRTSDGLISTATLTLCGRCT